jgi:hypothetical protein
VRPQIPQLRPSLRVSAQKLVAAASPIDGVVHVTSGPHVS